MSAAPATAQTPLRYRGSNNAYLDIAIRNAEHLGFSLEYARHPTNVGFFILRFVVHGEGVKAKNYTHLTYRETANFLIPGTPEQPTGELFKGVRLNKIAIPVCKPAIYPHEVGAFAQTHNLWPLVVEWVAEQVVAEGFTLTVDLASELPKFVTFPVTEGVVESVIAFPDLAAPDQQAAALKLVQKPEPDEDEDEDVEDEDNENGDKSWLN